MPRIVYAECRGESSREVGSQVTSKLSHSKGAAYVKLNFIFD